MICDPFICIKGPKIGEIHWIETLGFTTDIGYHDHEQFAGCHFRRYADFEREKLIAMKAQDIHLEADGYILYTPQKKYSSGKLIGYYCGNHSEDSESSRLLKRAAFLREVCKREGVDWIPETCEDCGKSL